ncbi:DmsC/YnfH family molybdoenzyme membrane anchor subunit [Actinotalea sp. K2]|uniref:dimethyl sulfoxide reductase anchor subunit family protein n=1 Tax=Actinotalea sp. K2 TaxID=2939438 RepID=UPI0020171E4D|nr:DmsC/YnfH family molybdoenzyme membrane anchor subunit [Actinotalea sp. K2]MCL3860738.1 dimethyl sulfoxide reductase anchor subunit [Actinotalea sp. K2]
MHVDELPLVIFTIFAQMSVGAFVVLGVVHLLARRRASTATVDRLSDPALYAIGPVMVLGLAASILHLGNPLNAINVLNQLGSSWLSREILFGCAFAGLGAAFAVVQWRGWFTPVLRQVLAGVTALVGLGLVWSMAMVYMLPTVPAWNSPATPVIFFTTTFLLGALAVGSAFVWLLMVQRRRGVAVDDEVTDLVRTSLRWIAVTSIVLLGVQFVVLPTYALSLAGAGGAAATSAASLMTWGGVPLVLRLVLAFVGAGLLGVFLFKVAVAGRERLLFTVTLSAFGLVLVSEGLGRALFYESFTRIGM